MEPKTINQIIEEEMTLELQTAIIQTMEEMEKTKELTQTQNNPNLFEQYHKSLTELKPEYDSALQAVRNGLQKYGSLMMGLNELEQKGEEDPQQLQNYKIRLNKSFHNYQKSYVKMLTTINHALTQINSTAILTGATTPYTMPKGTDHRLN